MCVNWPGSRTSALFSVLRLYNAECTIRAGPSPNGHFLCHITHLSRECTITVRRGGRTARSLSVPPSMKNPKFIQNSRTQQHRSASRLADSTHMPSARARRHARRPRTQPVKLPCTGLAQRSGRAASGKGDWGPMAGAVTEWKRERGGRGVEETRLAPREGMRAEVCM